MRIKASFEYKIRTNSIRSTLHLSIHFHVLDIFLGIFPGHFSGHFPGHFLLVLVIPTPRWCVEGIEAFTKCIRIKKAMDGRIKCVLGKGEEDCFTKIAEKMADIATFDGGSIYHAGNQLINHYSGLHAYEHKDFNALMITNEND